VKVELLNIEIEKFHMIFKNLIRIGKDLDAERFRAQLLSQGFVQEERVIPTPTGPLKEYLLREPKKLRDLIVVSVKGFVVDAWDLDSGIDLVGLAYDVYETILGDLIKHTIVDIIGNYTATVFIGKDPEKVLSKCVTKDSVIKLRKSLNRSDVKPFMVGFCWGIPRPPHEWIIANITPVMEPTGLGRRGRIQLSIRYQGVDPEKGISFLRNINELIKKIVNGII